MISLIIPGKPHAQGRPRAVRCGRAVRMIDHPYSRAWKRAAASLMRNHARSPLEGAVAVTIEAIFARPKSDRRNASFSRCTARNGDVDNIAKAVLDAGNGILWHDDSQVAHLVVHRWYAPSGDPARVRVTVDRAEASVVRSAADAIARLCKET